MSSCHKQYASRLLCFFALATFGLKSALSSPVRPPKNGFITLYYDQQSFDKKSKYTGDVEGMLTSIYTIRKLHPQHPIVLLTPPGTRGRHIDALKALNVDIRNVDVLYPKSCVPKYHSTISSKGGPKYRLRYGFTKVGVWKQTDFDELIYFDTDMLMLKPLDHLFGKAAELRAVKAGGGSCDPSDTHGFNAGFMVLKPSKARYDELVRAMDDHQAHSCREQYLHNHVFKSDFGCLHRSYNCQDEGYKARGGKPHPCVEEGLDTAHVVHWTGFPKPWMTTSSQKRRRGRRIATHMDWAKTQWMERRDEAMKWLEKV